MPIGVRGAAAIPHAGSRQSLRRDHSENITVSLLCFQTGKTPVDVHDLSRDPPRMRGDEKCGGVCEVEGGTNSFQGMSFRIDLALLIAIEQPRRQRRISDTWCETVYPN